MCVASDVRRVCPGVCVRNDNDAVFFAGEFEMAVTRVCCMGVVANEALCRCCCCCRLKRPPSSSSSSSSSSFSSFSFSSFSSSNGFEVESFLLSPASVLLSIERIHVVPLPLPAHDHRLHRRRRRLSRDRSSCLLF